MHINKLYKKFDISEINQIIDGKYIGYHHDLSSLPIQGGDFVLIRKGIQYHSLRDGKTHITKKSYKVFVDHVIHGTQYIDSGQKIIKNTEIVWAGSGRYWNRADINDVLKVPNGEWLTKSDMIL